MARGMHKPGKLKRRVDAYNGHGKNPQAPNNPSNDRGQGCDMHKPGSYK